MIDPGAINGWHYAIVIILVMATVVVAWHHNNEGD